MNNTDWITMLGNISRAINSVEHLIAGVAYILGILFYITAVVKFKKIGDYRVNSGSSEKMFIPIAYLIGGSALIFLPTALTTLSNTAFGSNSNPLQFIRVNPYDIKTTMTLLLQGVGLIWAVRGITLMVHASEPGVQEGSKGFAFLCAGILAMNLDASISGLNWVMDSLLALTLSVKTKQGY